MIDLPISSATAAVIVFTLTQIVALVTHQVRQRRERQNLIAGVYEEVRLNLAAVTKFLDANPHPPQQLIDLVNNDRKYRPHMLYAQQTKFYDANLAKLPMINASLNRLLIDFYSDLESVEVEFKAIQYASFETVTNRANVISQSWTTMSKAKLSGEIAKSYLDGRYTRVLRAARRKR
jgi:hypothetical protein